VNPKTIDALVSQEQVLEHTRTGNSPEIRARAFIDNLHYVQGRPAKFATLNDRFMALAYTLRDRMLHRWIKTVEPMTAPDFRVVGYLSAEYLPGPHLQNRSIQ
jgi:starch phosphorylase